MLEFMNNLSGNKPLILVISHVIPYPPAAGNEIRILNKLQMLQEFGFGVILLINQEFVSDDIKSKLNLLFEHVHLISEDYNIESIPKFEPNLTFGLLLCDFLKKISISRFLPTSFCENIQKKAEIKKWFASDRLINATKSLYSEYQPVAVMVEYIFTSPCLKVIPKGTLKIIDTHDMFSRRKEQVVKHGIDDLLSISRREERRYLLNADLILAIQSHEAKMFQQLVPELDVITVGIDFDIIPKPDKSEVVPGRILIIGSDNPLNIHGLKEFYSYAWPEIKSKLPGATLCIAGKLANGLKTNDQQVFLMGWVKDLSEEYEKAAVVVNPTVAGTGLKIKSAEALCYGKALISTPNGVEGLISDDPEVPCVIAHDWSGFANSVVTILQSEEKRVNLEKRALKFAAENLGKEIVYLELKEKLQRFFNQVNQPF